MPRDLGALLSVRFLHRWGDKLVGMAIDAVKRVRNVADGRVEVDVKRYARVEKIPGGELDDCKARERERKKLRKSS